MGKTAVAVICTNSHFKEEMVGHVQQNISMIVSIFYPCPIVLYTSLQLRIYFYGPEEGIKLARK